MTPNDIKELAGALAIIICPTIIAVVWILANYTTFFDRDKDRK
jgi:uncharacterized membrane protein